MAHQPLRQQPGLKEFYRYPEGPPENTFGNATARKRVNLLGSLRKSMKSNFFLDFLNACNVVRKVTFFVFSFIRRARLFPNDMALPPPACICRMKKIQIPTRTIMGSQVMNSGWTQGESSMGLAENLYTFIPQKLNEVRIVGGVGMKGFPIKTFAIYFISLENNPGDLALVDQFEEFSVAELGFFLGKLRPIKKVKKHGHYQANKQPKGNIFIKRG